MGYPTIHYNSYRQYKQSINNYRKKHIQQKNITSTYQQAIQNQPTKHHEQPGNPVVFVTRGVALQKQIGPGWVIM